MIVVACPDGAADAPGAGPTCLEQAATPTLDRLTAGGVLRRVATIPAGVSPGTEVGLPALLGVALDGPLPRGLVEAAAAGIPVADGEGAWRLDLVPAIAGDDALAARLDAAVRPLAGRVHHLSGHRFLLVGPRAWGHAPPGPHQVEARWQELARGPFTDVAAVATQALAGTGSAVWAWGRLATGAIPSAPRLLGRPVTVVTAGGPAAGIARLLGCKVAALPASDGHAVVAAAGDGTVVLLHDPVPDDAAHRRDRAGKVAALERFDRDVLAPVAEVLARRGGRLVVSPDHGCDPADGRHTAEPVPALVWSRDGGARTTRRRMTERDAGCLAPVPAPTLLAEQMLLPGTAA